MRLLLHTTLVALSLSIPLVSREGMLLANEDLKTIEQRVQDVKRRVSSAVVCVGDGLPGWSGVILTAEGHVLSYRNSSPGSEVPVCLSDGRRVTAKVLGWSNEFGVGLSKIIEHGPWPYVEPGTSTAVKAGEWCLAVGYPPRVDLQHEDRPAIRLGSITLVGAPFWLSVSCGTSLHEIGTSVFDMNGKLLGIKTPASPGETTVVCADVVQANWDDLAAGKNLDWVRYPPARNSLYYQLGHEKQLDRLGIQSAKDIVDKPQRGSDLNPQDLQPVLEAAQRRATAASVRIRSNERLSWNKKMDERWSGTIVSSDGYVLTCAHTDQLPGEKVTVALPDGRDTAGVVLGTNKLTDVGLVKITGKGPWPHVEMGISATMWPTDPAIIVGYPAARSDGQPNNQRQPRVVTAKIQKTPYVCWGAVLMISSDVRQIFGGMSGGGIFDLNGRIVAVHTGQAGPRIEVVRVQWDYLKAQGELIVSSNEPLGEITRKFANVKQAAESAVVEVLVKGRRRALGTVIDRDGWLLTKSSELYGALTCRFADGRVLPARVRGRSLEHDLALLKVEAADLKTAEFRSEECVPGTLLATKIPGERLRVGVVSYNTRAIPPEPIWSGEGLHDTVRGLEVRDIPRFLTFGANGPKPIPGFRAGDVLLELEGHATPSLEEFSRLMANMMAPNYHVGDPITSIVRRRDREVKVYGPLPAKPGRPNADTYYSPRRAGFPEVFDTDIPLTPELCGGPLVDRSGRVVGIVIASRGDDQRGRYPTHVIPVAVARRVARNLIAGISKK